MAPAQGPDQRPKNNRAEGDGDRPEHDPVRIEGHHDPGDPWNGKELDLAGYKERVRISRAPFPDQAFDVQDILADESKVMVTWLWAGTHKGDFPGFPATGSKITMSGATVYYIADGRLTGHWQITDRLGVFMQLQQGAAGR